MKIIMILTVLIGLGLGYWLSLDPGYVLLSWYHYTFESSLWLFLIMLLFLGFALYALFSMTVFVGKGRFGLKDMRSKRKQRLAQEDTIQGLFYLANGQWDKAERILTRNAQHLKTPLVNYLAAARAAQERGDFTQADSWLEKAANSTKGADLTVGIAQADLLISRNHLEQALAVLLDLYNKNAQHVYVLKLLVKVYTQLEEWSSLQQLLPNIRKFTQISADKLEQLEQNVHLQLLERLAREDKQHNPKQLQVKNFFTKLSRHERYRLAVVRRYLQILVELKRPELAEEELKQALKYVWHDDLVDMYGKLAGENSKAQFLFAQQQLKQRPNDPILLLTLTRLAIKNSDLKKARAYVETGLRIKPLPSLQAQMGQVLVLEGNKSAACDYLLKAVDGLD